MQYSSISSINIKREIRRSLFKQSVKGRVMG
jgi:hypothetical protein